jgi:hypothetical protein
MNRVYVDMICRQLAGGRVITRSQGADGKLVNAAAAREQPAGEGLPTDPPERPARQRRPRGCDGLGCHRTRQSEHVPDPDRRGNQVPAPPLPDLIPPIDRRYTFFTGQKMVASDRAAFLEWLPVLASIGAKSREPIRDTIKRGGFMATGEAKVIDNAIMGFMQQRNQR